MGELLKTPLHNMHLEAGAKMVPFAGYDMPVQYPGGIKTEHLQVRAKAGLFDVSHMGQVLVEGEQAMADLERLLPVDLASMALNQQQYTFLPAEDGGILDDLIVTRWSENAFFLVFNAGCKDKDIDHCNKHLSESTQLTLFSDKALLALQGPAAAKVMAKLSPAACELAFMHGFATQLQLGGGQQADVYVTRSGYTGEDGFEISVDQQSAQQVAQALLQSEAVEWIGLGARDSLRLEAGLCLYGHDLDEQTSPVEAGLMWSVSKPRRRTGENPGGFISAEAIFAQQQAGAPRKRVGLRVEGKAPVREGATLVDADGNEIGVVTSGGFAPSLGAPIAMGYVATEHAAIDSQLFAVVRDKPRAVSVVKMPFIQQNYVRD